MNSRDLDQLIDRYDNTPEGFADSLKLDLSDIVLRRIVGKVTQASIAGKAGIKPQMMTRIVHAASNCTFKTAANILFALGVKARLVEMQPDVVSSGEIDVRYLRETVTRRIPKSTWIGEGRTNEEKHYEKETI